MANNMSKPILVVRFPDYWRPEHMKAASKTLCDNKSLNDEYHVIVLADKELKQVKFECYNSPYSSQKLENFTKLIETSIENSFEQKDLTKKQEENE